MNFKFPTWNRLHQQTNKTALNSSTVKSGLPPGSLIHIGEKHWSGIKHSSPGVEDILSTQQRPKLEEYEDFLYLVIKGISIDRDIEFSLRYQQISILLLANVVITFKEKTDDTFSTIYNNRTKRQRASAVFGQ